MEQKPRDKSFVLLWIVCSIAAFLAGGYGRTMEGKPFLPNFGSFWQNAFYTLGGVVGCLVIGWVLAWLIRRLRR